MQQIQFPLVILVILCAVTWFSCGNDDDDDNEGGSGIEGTVTSINGKPVVGMRVSIVSGTTGFPEIAPETNDEGYYQIGSVPPGTFEVAVTDREGNRISLT